MKANTKIYYSRSENDTLDIASKIALHVKFGTVIGLKGNLGAGKTVFARGFIKALGINSIVSSPTFTLIKEYERKDSKWVFHLDLYRIQDLSSALDFGIEEYINNPDAIALIEWPDCIIDILPKDTVYIEIEQTSNFERTVTVVSTVL